MASFQLRHLFKASLPKSIHILCPEPVTLGNVIWQTARVSSVGRAHWASEESMDLSEGLETGLVLRG